MPHIFFPPEWYQQSAVQLTWPHENTDWNYILDDITSCFVQIAHEVLKREKLLIICKDATSVKLALGNNYNRQNLILVEIPTNDTWARDHAPISVFIDGKPVLYDFTFNGWGLKFAANFDNQINKNLHSMQLFAPDVHLSNKKSFTLEGGALESDGKGTLLTTSECLLSPNRNSYLSKNEIEEYLLKEFGLNRILWLDYGYLAGDDTDSHIDTLARFCDERTIAYVKCDDKDDEHFEALQKMETQLKNFVDFEGQSYRLIALPMVQKIIVDDERLPATYANFLIINDAVLLPVYNVPQDKIAEESLKEAFPTREVITIDCTSIIRQHGSLHCVTMQYPEGFII